MFIYLLTIFALIIIYEITRCFNHFREIRDKKYRYINVFIEIVNEKYYNRSNSIKDKIKTKGTAVDMINVHKQIDDKNLYPKDKRESYKLIQAQLKSLLENETIVISNLGNTSALLNLALHDINWVGFYLIKNDELILGPFQGRPACNHIPVGKGVCGAAVSQGKTQVVPDVHAFPGHIACDSESNSEIVVPIFVDNTIVGVLDIDSPVFNRFDEIDREGLEEVVRILAGGCDWKDFN